jgi:NitT/TauT family transport system substrate-binding protein
VNNIRFISVIAAIGVLIAACSPSAAPAPTSAPAAAPTQATAAKPAAPTSAPANAAPAATQPPVAKPAATATQPAAAKPAATATQPAAAKPAAPTTAPANAAPGAGAAAAPTTAAFNGPPVALHVSYSNLIADNLPEWMALESGIFKQNGLDVTLDNIASSTGIPALLSGQVQIAQLGGSETISAAAGGGDLVIIGIIGGFYPFVFMAPASITTTDQLKGKKIGVSNIGSSSDIATRVMLTKVGLDPDSDVTIIAVGSLSNRMAALLNGAIDGGVAQPPDQLALEDKGFHVIYDLAAQKLPSVGTAVVVQRSWLNSNKDVAQRYIDSLVQAVAKSRADKETALTVLQKYLNTDDQRALGVTYDFFVGQVTPQYPLIKPEQFTDAIKYLSESNEKIKDFDLSKILDNSFAQSAFDRKVGGPVAGP